MEIPIKIRRRYFHLEERFVLLVSGNQSLIKSLSKESYIYWVYWNMTNYYVLYWGDGTSRFYEYEEMFKNFYKERIAKIWDEGNGNTN